MRNSYFLCLTEPLTDEEADEAIFVSQIRQFKIIQPKKWTAEPKERSDLQQRPNASVVIAWILNTH